MKTSPLATAWVFPLAMLGCQHIDYDVTVDPTGDSMERLITMKAKGAFVVRDDSGEVNTAMWGPSVEGNRVAGLYGAPCPTLRAKKSDLALPDELEPITFRGTFRGRTPDDVGGAGFYTRIKTKMGCACLYVERFRGEDDPAADLQECFHGVDEAVSCLSGWVNVQLGDDPDAAKLQRFLDKRLRSDLKNVYLAAWTCRNAPLLSGQDRAAADAAQRDALARVLAFLVERGYLRPSDLPALYRCLKTMEFPRPMVKRFAKRFLTEELKITGQEAHRLAAAVIDYPEGAAKSCQAWKTGKPALRPWVHQWRELARKEREERRARGAEADDLPTGAMTLAAMEFYLLGRSCLLDACFPPDTLTFRLRTKARPLHTSGQWDEEAALVRWNATLRCHGLPTLCYALWCWENAGYQEKHFGRVVLAGQDLVSYCLWRKGLSAEEARKWEAFLDSCRPGPKLPERVRGFRFSPQAKGEEARRAVCGCGDYAEVVTASLAAALDP